MKIIESKWIAYILGFIPLLFGLYFQDPLLSVIASTFGVISVYLISIGRIENFYWGIISVISLLSFSILNGVYFEVFIQLFYLLTTFLGLAYWKITSKGPIIKSKKINLSGNKLIIYISIIFFIFSGILLNIFVDGLELFISITLLIMTMTAQIMMVIKKTEQYLLWIIINISYILIYVLSITKGEPISISLTIMYTLYLYISIQGLYLWRNILSKK